jgi:hypothetical protein
MRQVSDIFDYQSSIFHPLTVSGRCRVNRSSNIDLSIIRLYQLLTYQNLKYCIKRYMQYIFLLHIWSYIFETLTNTNKQYIIMLRFLYSLRATGCDGRAWPIVRAGRTHWSTCTCRGDRWRWWIGINCITLISGEIVSCLSLINCSLSHIWLSFSPI